MNASSRQGEISVLSGAPYGYRYERKSDEQAAGYAVIDAEAQVVRQIYELYTVTGLSIGAVTRRLNELAIPTKKGAARWERSTVWAILRNPAYRGMACFGRPSRLCENAPTTGHCASAVAYPRATVPITNCRPINGFRFRFPRWSIRIRSP
jgi:hypothetical protein